MKTLIIVGIAVIILAITNPAKEDHVAAVKTELLSTVMSETLGQTKGHDDFERAGNVLGLTLGMNIVNELLGQSVTSTSFVLFSLTRISNNGNSRIIGIGALGNVWLLPSFKRDIELSSFKK